MEPPTVSQETWLGSGYVYIGQCRYKISSQPAMFSSACMHMWVITWPAGGLYPVLLLWLQPLHMCAALWCMQFCTNELVVRNSHITGQKGAMVCHGMH